MTGPTAHVATARPPEVPLHRRPITRDTHIATRNQTNLIDDRPPPRFPDSLVSFPSVGMFTSGDMIPISRGCSAETSCVGDMHISTPGQHGTSWNPNSLQFREGDFASGLKSLKAFKAGQKLAPLTGLTKGKKAYTTVQCGPGPEDHIELNSDLVYINHSCEPNVAFDLSSPDPTKWHLRALKDITAGEAVTFFYPSTEWDMDQPFKCACGKPSCLKTIQGAKHLPKKELVARGFVSPWILRLAEEQEATSSRKELSRL